MLPHRVAEFVQEFESIGIFKVLFEASFCLLDQLGGLYLVFLDKIVIDQLYVYFVQL